MPRVEVPREKWARFCDLFSRQHQSWIVHLNVRDPDIPEGQGAEPHTHALTSATVFRGVTAEPRDGNYTVSIIAGVPPDEINHFIYDPTHIYFEKTDEGFHEGLTVEGASGSTTMLRFQAAALPELLDGILESEVLSTS